MADPETKYKVTPDMWNSHLEYYILQPELFENLADDKIELYLAKTKDIPANTAAGSWQSHVYPFSTDEDLRRKYVKFSGDELQVGMFLEEIDAICAESAY